MEEKVKDDGVLAFKELDDFLRDEEQKEKFLKRRHVVYEEYKSIEEEYKKQFDEERYKYSTPAVKMHKFWANDDFSSIARVEEVGGNCGVVYFKTNGDDIDYEYHTSTLGFLWGHCVPITEEKFDELHKKFEYQVMHKE